MQYDDGAATAGLIRVYGEFWNPDLVNWKRGRDLLGIDPENRIINAYEQRGIYVLYDDYIPVYVGKASKISIGSRLRSHRESQRRGPRWDRFSWFGLKRINKNGELGILKSKNHVPTSELIATLEALLILVAEPRLNARREKLKNAIKLDQSDKGKQLTELEQQIALVNKKLDSLNKRIKSN